MFKIVVAGMGLTVTHRHRPGSPQWSVGLLGWDLTDSLTRSQLYLYHKLTGGYRYSEHL